jgi:purine-nucleoside phosphorylase
MNNELDELRAFDPQWAIVLGSGLGSLVDRIDVQGQAPFNAIPELPASKVPGHAGRCVWGTFGGQRLLAMQGRVHLYEGHLAAQVTAGIRWMASLGVRRLVLTNAAGTLNEAHPPGSWMMLSDHLNLTGTTPLLGGPNFFDMTEVYTPALRTRFREAAAGLGVDLHEGVYAGLLGPQYETKAEIRMLRVLGADAVGMSTVLEAIQARALGMEVAGFSCLTNWAAGIGAELLNHEEVLSTGKGAAEAFCRILERAIGGSA